MTRWLLIVAVASVALLAAACVSVVETVPDGTYTVLAKDHDPARWIGKVSRAPDYDIELQPEHGEPFWFDTNREFFDWLAVGDRITCHANHCAKEE